MNDAPLMLYTHPQSRGRVARWALEETGLPYEVTVLDYGTSMKVPDYLAINPLGKVPAIRHGDVVVTENLAIGLYLGDIAAGAALAPAVGSHARGEYYRWIMMLAPLEQAMMAKHAGAPENAMSAGYGRFNDLPDAYAARLQGRDFIVGDAFTMADLLAASYLEFFMQFKLLEPREVFERYVALHKARPAAQCGMQKDVALMPATATS